jgi:hypothetical protein
MGRTPDPDDLEIDITTGEVPVPSPRTQTGELLAEIQRHAHSGEAPIVFGASGVSVAEPPLDALFLSIVAGPGAGTMLAIAEGEHVIGRSDACWLAINHHLVSREHAIVLRRKNEVLLRDAGSQNGTFLNGSRLVGRRALKTGDEVRIGETRLQLGTGPSGVELTMPTMIVPVARPPRRWWVLAVGATLFTLALAGVVLHPAGFGYWARLNGSGPAAPVVAAPAASAPEPTPPPTPVAPAAPPAEVHSSPPAPEPELAPPPAPPVPARPVDPLEAFRAGDVDPAIAGAEKAGNLALAKKMAAFRSSRDAAHAKLAEGDGAGALRLLKLALQRERLVTGGRGTLADRLKEEAAQLASDLKARPAPARKAQQTPKPP